MANNEETTTRFKVDISELKAQFQEAQRSIRLVNSEFKSATAGMDDWAKTSDGLSAKIKQMNGVLDGEKSKLQSLKDQYALVVQQEGANSKSAQELAIKINNQEAVVKSTEKSLKQYTQQLENLESSTNGVADNLDEVADATNDLNESVEKSGNGFSVLKGAVSNFIGGALNNLIGKIGEAISSLWNLSDETKEFRDQMNKLSASAEDNGYSVDYANKTFKKFYKILGDETASNTATSNLLASGMAVEDLNKVTTAMVGVWGKFGDSIPLDGLAESINETAKVGQITGNLADALNWAGISEDDFNIKLAECSSEQERQSLIADTLSNTYSSLADTYMESNKSIMEANEVNLEYTENLARLGEKIEPIQTELKRGFNGILSSFIDMLDGVDFDKITQGIRNVFDYINDIDWSGLGKSVNSGIGIIKEVFQWILDNQTIILSALASIVTGLIAMNVSNIVMNLTKSFEGLKLVITQSAIAQKLLNSTMLKNPVGLVIGAIAGLVAGFVVLWNKSDKFRAFWINLWEKIKEVVPPVWEKIKQVIFVAWDKIKAVTSTVGTAISSFFTSAWEKIKSVWSAVLPYFQMIWDNVFVPVGEIIASMINAFKEAWLLIQTVWNLVAPYFQNIWNTIKEVFSYVKDFFYNIFLVAWEVIKTVWDLVSPYFLAVWGSIKAVFSVVQTFFSGVFSVAWESIKAIWNTATSFFKSIWDTIAGIFSVVRNVLTGNWSDAWEGIKGIVSTWKDYFSGVWDNIKNVFSAVKDWFKDTFQSAWDAVKEVFSTWVDFFGGLWDDIKNKFTDMGTNIADAIGGSVKAGMNGVISMIEGTLNGGIDMINGAIDWINTIPNVNIGYLGGLNLPRLAKGGIVNNPTVAQIGEQGREAIIPLENNLGWIKNLANQLAIKINQGTGFNNSTSSHVTNNFYQTNNSPKALSRLEIYRQSKNLLSLKGA